MTMFPRRLVSIMTGGALLASPVLFVLCARFRFGGWSPFHGSGAIDGWIWRFVDSLSRPIEMTAAVDLVIRVGLIAGWVSLIAVVLSIPGELSALRSGSARRSGPASRVARVLIGGFLVFAQPMSGAVLAADVAMTAELESDTGIPASDTWTVKAGESVYGIAEHLSSGDSSQVFPIADGILELNLGTVMVDGSVFSNPAAIRPGWTLLLPEVETPVVEDQAVSIHRVEEGDTLASIAAEHLGDGDRWEEIFELNEGREMQDGRAFSSASLILPGWELALPGTDVEPEVNTTSDSDRSLPEHIVAEIENWEPDTVIPPSIPEVEPVSEEQSAPEIDIPIAAEVAIADGKWVEMAGATMLAAGLVGSLVIRRRRGLRRVRAGQRPRRQSEHLVDIERRVMSGAAELAALDRMAALDLALRSLAPMLVAQHTRFHAVSVTSSGAVSVVLDDSVRLEEPWVDMGSGEWQLSTVPTLEPGVFPFPTIVQVGTTESGSDVFVDLEMAGGVTVSGEGSAEVIAALRASLAMSPFAEQCTILDESDVEASGPPECDRHLAPWHARVTLDEPMHPVLVLVGDSLRPVITIDDRSPLSLELGGDGSVLLPPTGQRITPLRLASAEQEAVEALAAEPSFIVDEPAAVARPSQLRFPPILVRILGEPTIELESGDQIEFERSKSLELVTWMATHRERPTRSRARAALWDTEVRSATFSNVVSDARRSLARAVEPVDGSEWIDRTLTEELRLHDDVLTDADVLRAARDLARPLPPESAVGMLRPALELVRGLPFAGTAYLWPDPEGITSELVVLATGAASELASWYLALGDLDGVFWATARGLQVLPGHEELIALRMRARAARGDTAGLRQEWASYERVLADDWSGGEPAPELVELRRELLSARTSASAST